MNLRYWLVVLIFLLTFGFTCLQAQSYENDSSLITHKLIVLDIEISCDKIEFIQGESINILVKIKNNSSDTLRISKHKYYIFDFDKDSTFSNYYDRGIVDISPFGTYYYMVEPLSYLFFRGIDLSTYTLKPGNYDYYLSKFLGKKEYVSNKINIIVNSIPDSLLQAFNDLIFIPNNPRSIDTAEQLLTKYKGTFYEENYYEKVMSYPVYYNAIQNKVEAKEYRTKAVNLYKEFILKFPNSTRAYLSFNKIMYNYENNQFLIEDILISLKNSQPECKLLEVLKNKPEYLNKEIKYLLD
jgi:hypothetical protein